MNSDIRRGKIFYIHPDSRFRTVGAETYSGRPGIIVSNNNINNTSGCYEVVYLTTQEKNNMPTHFVTNASGKNSTALCEQVVSVSEERIGDYYGRLSADEMNQLDKCLLISLGLCSDEEEYFSYENEKEGKSNPYSDKIESLQKEIEILKEENIKVSAKYVLMRELYNDSLKNLSEK